MSGLARTLAVLSVLFLALLAAAPLRPYFAEWRGVQARYNRLARETGGVPVPIAVQQIWKPSLGIADRCVTCHLGMGTAVPIGVDPLFRAHPAIPHEPSEFGCTVCHGGQGRATTKDAAHGFVSHWDEHLLDGEHQTAGCGTCHREYPVASRAALAGGQQLIERLDCLSCHKIDGRGRGSAPDLTHVGLRGYQTGWHRSHLAERERQASGPWRESYGDIAAPDLAALDTWLRTRVGAPRIVEAQALAMERGCLGCHKVGGRGGDMGPALDEVGRRPVGDLRFAGVPGEQTLANYLKQHFIDPPGVVAGSLMPPLAASEAEADLLTSYALFLRSRPLPAEFMPKTRVRHELLREAPPALSGAQLFGAFCSGCHGPSGQGRTYGNLDVRFPAIGSADFLDVASDTFIERTLRSGRPGRRMPALGATGGSLSGADIASVIAHLRSLSPGAPTFAQVSGARADGALGAAIYAADCAACHGAAGEGTPLGPPLAAADRRLGAAAAYQAIAHGVAGTAMPAYTVYDAQALRSLMAHLDRLARERTSGARAAWRAGAGDASRGRAIYERSCAGCHGAEGEGKNGPALANAGFRQAATPDLIAVTVVRGRRGTLMPAFGRDGVGYSQLASSEVLDVSAFVARGLGAGAAGPPASGGTAAAGTREWAANTRGPGAGVRSTRRLEGARP